MRAIDAVVQILRKEGVEFLVCFRSTSLTEAAANSEMKLIVCRQERVGVGIADGFSRVSSGRRIGVFTMEFGPGAEDAFTGVVTAFSDSVPALLLSIGHKLGRAQVRPHFSSVRSYSRVTKHAEQVSLSDEAPAVIRRAFSQLRNGRLSPVLVEIPADLALEDIEFISGFIRTGEAHCERCRSRRREDRCESTR